ncbi:unnamed protein product [Gordionus sp. m RMFG-2023]|uniref:mediator of RNA polymerase II transcription subunit 19-like isoform X2 n=1 Tax=Gordionus sp. m RMFG-2023 TaxID=3053472 RepID=UPI0030DF8EA0
MNFQNPLNLNNDNDELMPNIIPGSTSYNSEAFKSEPTKAIVTIKRNPLTVRTVPIPFYLMKELPKPSNLTGHTNLLSYYGLEEYYRKMTRKKLIDKLDEYEDLLGENLNIPGYVDNSSLKFLIDHPPICGKEIRTLSSSAFAGFRLNPGTLPLQYQTLAKKAANINKSTHQNYSAYSSQTYSALDHQPFVKLMSGEKDPLGTHTDQSHEPELLPQRRKIEHKDRKKIKKAKLDN